MKQHLAHGQCSLRITWEVPLESDSSFKEDKVEERTSMMHTSDREASLALLNMLFELTKDEKISFWGYENITPKVIFRDMQVIQALLRRGKKFHQVRLGDPVFNYLSLDCYAEHLISYSKCTNGILEERFSITPDQVLHKICLDIYPLEYHPTFSDRRFI